MKQETKETKKPKSFIKKAKKVRSMVMMTLLCVLMMSAATYAWFTLSNTAKASNLTMTVGDVTGLQVADYESDTAPTDESDKWKSATSEVKFNGKLLPANSTDGISIYEPHYTDDGSVDKIETAVTTKYLTNTSLAGAEGYYVEHSFWIRAQGPDGGTTKVQLDKGVNLNSGVYTFPENDTNANKPSGTYCISKAAGEDGILPSAAVRIGIINNKTSTATVFEPNSDFNTEAQKKATDTSGASGPSSPITQSLTTGEISTGNNVVFTLDNNEPTKITLRIWLEGTDKQCGNEIAAQDIVTQLKFSTVTTSAAP